MLFESIRWQDGRFHHLELHTERLQRTRSALFGLYDHWDLESLLDAYEVYGMPLRQILSASSCTKLRFDYNRTEFRCRWAAYKPKRIRSLQLVQTPEGYSYAYKYADRSVLEALKASAPHTDEILICTGDLVRDTSYSNVVFSETRTLKGKLYTPAQPLLCGTMRSALLASGAIEEADIRVTDLKKFKTLCLINAMLPLGTVRVPLVAGALR